MASVKACVSSYNIRLYGVPISIDHAAGGAIVLVGGDGLSTTEGARGAVRVQGGAGAGDSSAGVGGSLSLIGGPSAAGTGGGLLLGCRCGKRERSGSGVGAEWNLCRVSCKIDV